jgi:hypothetical protein
MQVASYDIAGVDFPEDLTRSIVFVASRRDRFGCETGAAIAACLREAFDCVMVMRTGWGKRPEMPVGWRSGAGPAASGTMVAGEALPPFHTLSSRP